ncbi:MAG TPA: MATE family efflux transporter, partial [Rhodocyclaceae bacterium]|nr:MATE family efflux transporter [Rhodocyclaceae bacterium]
SVPSKRLHLVAITWPIFVENLLMALIGVVGLWLASRLSDGAVGALGLANQILGAFQILFRVVSIGTSVVVTQHHGGGDHPGAEQVAKAGLAAAVWVGIGTLLIVSLGAAQILALLHLPKDLYPITLPYTVALGFALAIDSITMTMIAVLRANTFTRDSMRIVLAMNVVQIAASFPLMFGFAKLPAMGLLGMGLAMVLSRMFALGLLWRAWRNRLRMTLALPEWFRLRRLPLASILHIGLPGAGEKVAYRVSFIMTVAMVASMGAVPLATHAYVWQAVQVVTLFCNSTGFGTEIVVGHLIGAGKLNDANRIMWRATIWSLAAMIACAIASYFITPLAVAHATSDPQILALVTTIVFIELFLEPGRTFNVVVASGLRASGDARFPVKVSAVSVFVFGAGLGWLLGVHFGMGLPGVWIGYAADEWVRGLAVTARWIWLGWVPHARRAHRRIRVQRSGRALMKNAAACE